MALAEEEPLMGGTDDEETLGGNDVTEARDLLSGSSSTERNKKRLQIYNLLSISIISILWMTVAPLHYNDLSAIWMGTEEDLFSNVTFLSQMAMLFGFIAATYLSPVAIPLLGNKRTILTGTIALTLLCVATFFSNPYVLIPAYGVAGLFLNAHYTSLAVCCSQLAQRYCNTKLASSAHYDLVHILFYGVLHMFLLAGPLLRTLFYMLILEPGSSSIPLNHHCGASAYLGLHRGMGLRLEAATVHGARAFRIQATFGTYLTLAAASVLIAAACLYLPHKVELKTGGRRRCHAAIRSFLHLWQLRFFLLVPSFVFVGAFQCLLYQVVAKAYLGCVWYEKWSAYFLLCVSGLSFLSSVALAVTSQYLGRTKCVFIALLTCVVLLLVLLLVTPTDGNTALFFVIGGVGGMVDAVLQTQLSAKVSAVFWKARITSQCSYRSWQVAGILTVFVLQRFFSVIVVLVTTLVLLGVTLVTYFILEIRLRLDSNNESHAADHINLTSLDDGGWIPKLNPHAKSERTSLVTMNAQ